MEKSFGTEKNIGLFKFMILTILGLAMFLINVPFLGETLFLYAIHWMQNITSGIIQPILLIFLCVNGMMSLFITVFKFNFLYQYPEFLRLFKCSPTKLTINILAPLVTGISYFSLNTTITTLSKDVITMCSTTFVFLIMAKVMLPLISDYGLAEFLEEMLNPLMRPIFKLPGTAIMAIVTSSFVSVTIAIILISEQFLKGYYNKRETILLITCLTIPAMPITILLTNLIGISHLWGRFYLGITLTAVIMSTILIRIPPISKIPVENDPFNNSNIDTAKLTLPNIFKALDAAANKALSNHATIPENIIMVLKNMTAFYPFVIVYGTIAFFLIYDTPLITWLIKPYSLYLNLFHIPEASVAAPSLFLTSIDVILPPVILKNIQSEFTRFSVLLMLMDQMVYLAPFLLTMAIEGLINVKTLLRIAFLRILLVVPIAYIIARILI